MRWILFRLVREQEDYVIIAFVDGGVVVGGVVGGIVVGGVVVGGFVVVNTCESMQRQQLGIFPFAIEVDSSYCTDKTSN